jgi:hypothetical protein
MVALTTGLYNTALGTNTLATSVDGDYNTAIGYHAMKNYEGGNGEGQSVAVGYQAGKFTSTGERNTFIGDEAGQGITGTPLTGHNNVAVGQSAGLLLQGSANSNTLIGRDAGKALTTGDYNTYIGGAASEASNTANTCTLVGYDTEIGSVDATNQTGIGYGTVAVDTDQSVTLGNASVTAVYMAQDSGATVHCAAVTEGSSLEIKKNISEIESPLDKITKLRGIEFDYKETNKHSIGMIAEEVNEIFPELVSKDEDGKVTAMSYSRMTAVLLEAVKELSQEVKELKMNNIYSNKERD